MTEIAVIIPALNEASNIHALVLEVLATAVSGAIVSVIVADNGSTDATADEALAAGALVVCEPRRGYGYACAAGVAAAGSADILVFLDGDYSSLPSELPKVVESILSDQADLCIGSRVLGNIAAGSMPAHQRLGNRLAAWLIRMLYGVSLTDLGPYRAIKADVLRKLNMQEMTYGWPTEMTVKAARRKLRIFEAPVTFNPRQAGQSKVSGTLRGTVLAAWFIISVTLRYAWKPLPDSSKPE